MNGRLMFRYLLCKRTKSAITVEGINSGDVLFGEFEVENIEIFMNTRLSHRFGDGHSAVLNLKKK